VPHIQLTIDVEKSANVSNAKGVDEKEGSFKDMDGALL
jgi:hypothetical protein